MAHKHNKRRIKPTRRKWRVYGVKYPTNMDCTPWVTAGRDKPTDGWFWIRDGISLFIRVHRLSTARAVCRALNKAGF